MGTPPYENGFREGWMTPEVVRQLGFNSAWECLVHQEQFYQNEMAVLSSFQDRAFVARQAAYLEGFIAACRQSFGQMEQG